MTHLNAGPPLQLHADLGINLSSSAGLHRKRTHTAQRPHIADIDVATAAQPGESASYTWLPGCVGLLPGLQAELEYVVW